MTYRSSSIYNQKYFLSRFNMIDIYKSKDDFRINYLRISVTGKR